MNKATQRQHLKIKLLKLFKTLNAAHFSDAQQAQVGPAFGIQLMWTSVSQGRDNSVTGITYLVII